MGLDSKELGIDLNCSFPCKNSFSDVLSEISVIDDAKVKLFALEEYVHHLEDELRKVDSFKRVLPLSMNLLNDAILRLKDEAFQLNTREKVMPFKGGAELAEKKDWMSSAQLWTVPVHVDQAGHKAGEDSKRTRIPIEEGNLNQKRTIAVDVKQDFAVDGNLSLSIPVSVVKSNEEKKPPVKREIVPVHDRDIPEDSSSSQQQQSKKQRRCWSPELHQSFVNALMQLGGPEVATPKQIREIMQVDGLTNDEVKSHLQKYRLHIRKLLQSTDQSSSSVEMPNKVHWSRRRYSCKSLPPLSLAVTPSGSADGPSQLGVSVTVGESLEDPEEDAKSESQSWKGHHLFKPC